MDIERALDEPRVGHENLGLKGDTLLCETDGYNHGDNLYIYIYNPYNGLLI